MKILLKSFAVVLLGSSALFAMTPPPKPSAANVLADAPKETARPNPQFFPAGALPPTLDAAELRAAANLPFQELPPPRYDHKTTVPVWVIDVDDEKTLREWCNWPPRKNGEGVLAGCAQPITGGWRILLGPESDMQKHGVTRNMVLRHEAGHVNGWPADHSNGPPVVAAAQAPLPQAATAIEVADAVADQEQEQEPPSPPRRRPPRGYAPPPPGTIYIPAERRVMPCLPMIIGLPFCI